MLTLAKYEHPIDHRNDMFSKFASRSSRKTELARAVPVACVFGSVLDLSIKDKLQIFTIVDQQIFYNKQTTSTSMPPPPILDSKRVQQDDHLDATSVSNLEDQTLHSYGSIPNIVVEGKITRRS